MISRDLQALDRIREVIENPAEESDIERAGPAGRQIGKLHLFERHVSMWCELGEEPRLLHPDVPCVEPETFSCALAGGSECMPTAIARAIKEGATIEIAIEKICA
jgi:hypothetical protein